MKYAFVHPKDAETSHFGVLEEVVERYSMPRGFVFRIEAENMSEAQNEYEILLKEFGVEDVLEKCERFVSMFTPGPEKEVAKRFTELLKETYGL